MYSSLCCRMIHTARREYTEVIVEAMSVCMCCCCCGVHVLLLLWCACAAAAVVCMWLVAVCVCCCCCCGVQSGGVNVVSGGVNVVSGGVHAVAVARQHALLKLLCVAVQCGVVLCGDRSTASPSPLRHSRPGGVR